jgi:hypothetical protein
VPGDAQWRAATVVERGSLHNAQTGGRTVSTRRFGRAEIRSDRRARRQAWLYRPTLAVGFTLVLLGALIAHAPARASAAGGSAAPTRAARLANAASGSTHGGGGGGSGSGKPVGRATVVRTATPPSLTAAQARQRASIASRPLFAPAGPVARHASASPTDPAQTAAATKHAASARGPSASTDFDFYRASDVTGTVGGNADDTDEPSVANDGNYVLYTGNWYAATSDDSGHTFSYLNPYSLGPAPTLPNGGFCCDQVAIHSPSSRDITAWGLLYCNSVNCTTGVGDNLIRLAIARNQSDLASSTFDFYDFSAQSFGFAEGDWVDYPHFGLSANSLYLSMNVFSGTNFVSNIMVRFDLSSFANGGWSANWFTWDQDFTWTPTDTSSDTWGYWAATRSGNGSTVRVYNWPEGTDWHSVGWNDFAVSFNSENKNGVCNAPDGNNPCAFADSRVMTGGEVGTSTVYFMWNAAQGGGFPYPYTEWASFDVHTGPATSISPHAIWNSSFAWFYPGLGIDARGHLGISIQIAGSGTYPGSQFLVGDDISGTPPPFGAYYLDGGAHANNRWGDYLTSRPATTPGGIGNTWIATGYTLHDNGSGGAVVTPHFYWLGRERDDPFAPSSGVGYTNNFVKNKAKTVDTGYFYGPSNCTCDYYGLNNWGDGHTTLATMRRYPGFPRWFIISGTHTYTTATDFTTTLTYYDFFAHSTTATGTSHVAPK